MFSTRPRYRADRAERLVTGAHPNDRADRPRRPTRPRYRADRAERLVTGAHPNDRADRPRCPTRPRMYAVHRAQRLVTGAHPTDRAERLLTGAHVNCILLQPFFFKPGKDVYFVSVVDLGEAQEPMVRV